MQQLDWGPAAQDAPLTLGGPSTPRESEPERQQTQEGSSVGAPSSDDTPAPPPTLPVPAAATSPSPWNVSPAERDRYSQYFYASAHRDPDSSLEVLPAEAAVGVFRMSQFPDDALAKVWDLATFQQVVPGALTLAEFVVGMHILSVSGQQQLAIPDALPPELASTAAAVPPQVSAPPGPSLQAEPEQSIELERQQAEWEAEVAKQHQTDHAEELVPRSTPHRPYPVPLEARTACTCTSCRLFWGSLGNACAL